ncbi:MAG: DUF2291 family protein [Paracoccaceae bacterium]
MEANLTSRDWKAMVDVNGDGATDLTLQLGPVIKGTSLRDVAPFYRFGDFRDQIEFAKLARALKRVDFDLRMGAVNVLFGENGECKSS